MTAIDVSSHRRSGSRSLATRLLWLTLAWNLFEGSVGVTLGVLAGSVALLGFSFDSLIEVTAAAILLWRLSLPAADQRGEQREQIAHRIVGATFIALAIYIVIQAAYTITTRNNPEASSLGLLLAASSLLVQPALGIGKLRNARALASRALIAESKETVVCLSLSRSFSSSASPPTCSSAGGGPTPAPPSP